MEAAAGLAPERALLDELAQAGGDGLPERLADATATSSPTKSSSASGPIGWPAPSFMDSSTTSGSKPVSSSRRTLENR
jgi:hypothetical protein